MLISYHWLQEFFAEPLPSPEVVADALTFHSSEIESVTTVGNDTVFDVKVLPDKSAWMLSHRGVAKELATILGLSLANDPFKAPLKAIPPHTDIAVTLETDVCDYYSATLLAGIKVQPSPAWLKECLESVGQKSINNIVDITNYVMLHIGQPLHAFDATTLVKDSGYAVGVRQAKAGEAFVSLTSETYTLTAQDAVIIDGQDNPLALAGVKGGLHSGITNETTQILLEAAHFDRIAVRHTAARHRLPTDASKRYENGISRGVVSYAVQEAVRLFTELAGASVVGVAEAGINDVERLPVTVSLVRLNSVLGTNLAMSDVVDICKRFDFSYRADDTSVTVTPTFERDDIQIEADLIEEFGRMYGLDKIVSITPQKVDAVAINKRHYYAEVIRQTLVPLGFSEVYTSSFRSKDTVKVQNALASDKGYLRSGLSSNLAEARMRNLPYRDLLGLAAVKIFEIGTVFGETGEDFEVCLAVQTGTEYKVKTDEKLWREAVTALETALGVQLSVSEREPGVISFSMETVLSQVADPVSYPPYAPGRAVVYQAFSIYPPVSRDIAMWVGEGTGVDFVAPPLRAAAGPLLTTLTHLDTFTNAEGRTSVAFRLVFQSNEKTLDGSEVDELMQAVYSAAAGQGWEVR